MNDPQTAKIAVIKTLAIVGFIALIALSIWLLVQGVRFIPGKFASLASIAESIQNYSPTKDLTIATEKTMVNSGEAFKVTWTDYSKQGSYIFTYECIEGVSLDVRGENEEQMTIPCDQTLSLPNDATGLFLTVNSSAQRFVDVPFSVEFVSDDGKDEKASDASVTVVNATIPTTTRAVAGIIPEPEEENKEETPVVVAPTPAPTPAPNPKPAPIPVPQQLAPVAPTIPVSNPNGYTDLRVSFLGVGTMDGNTFVPSGSYDRDERGGLKFEIRNIGTKTSGDWTFSADLPAGIDYDSPKQLPLKPNEAAIFTLGFGVDESDKTRATSLTITAREPNDRNSANDKFTWSVKLTN